MPLRVFLADSALGWHLKLCLGQSFHDPEVITSSCTCCSWLPHFMHLTNTVWLHMCSLQVHRASCPMYCALCTMHPCPMYYALCTMHPCTMVHASYIMLSVRCIHALWLMHSVLCTINARWEAFNLQLSTVHGRCTGQA